MNLNATLFGQMITFALFVWFTMKFVWPPIVKALEDRQQRIAEGIAAADKSQVLLDETKQQVAGQLQVAKQQAADLIKQANQRASQIIEAAKADALKEGERLVHIAHDEIKQELETARNRLRGQLGELAVLGASRVIRKEIDGDKHRELLDEVIGQL